MLVHTKEHEVVAPRGCQDNDLGVMILGKEEKCSQATFLPKRQPFFLGEESGVRAGCFRW